MTDLLLDLYYVDLLMSLRKLSIIVFLSSLIVTGLILFVYEATHNNEDVIGSSYKAFKATLLKVLKISGWFAVISAIVFTVIPGTKFLDLRYSTLSEQYLETVKKSKDSEDNLVILELPEKTNETERLSDK